MKKQSGFTLIELAIVLVIIGLLLGGVLKGQELINSAKVKNMISDFKNTQVYIYGYQDKYKALPGDDSNAQNHVGSTALQAGAGAGDGVIAGNWNSTQGTDESVIFWQHVRLAGLAPGSTDFSSAALIAAAMPTNADGGRIGVESVSDFNTNVAVTSPSSLTGAFVICSAGVLGKFAKQIDTTLDDGATDTGSVRVYTTGSTTWETSTGATPTIVDSTTYNVCMSF